MAESGEQHDLVSFENPPVEEVAFAVQLSEAQLTVDDVVAIGRVMADDLPVRQLQPSLPRMVDPSGAPMFSIAPVGTALPRFWFVSHDGHRLVQVQEDRVAFNWRRLGRQVAYPRYSALRDEFVRRSAAMAEVAPAIAELAADFCELTYVNELAGPTVDAGPPRLDEVLRVTQSIGDGEFLPQPDGEQWAGQWTIQHQAGQRAGRLTAEARPVLRQRDGRPIYLMTMTAAMPGESLGHDDALEKLDLAHEWVVRGFADLTTATMHETWGRRL